MRRKRSSKLAGEMNKPSKNTQSKHSHFGVEQVVERGSSERSSCTVGEFLHSPVGEGGLLVVEENAAVLDSWGAMRTTGLGNVELGMLGSGDIGPPAYR